MTDREKVIKGLKCCGAIMHCNECPYDPKTGGCFRNLRADALNLLKEQEPIKPKRTVNEHGQVLSCGNCGAWFEVQYQKYCHECGRAVKCNDLGVL